MALCLAGFGGIFGSGRAHQPFPARGSAAGAGVVSQTSCKIFTPVTSASLASGQGLFKRYQKGWQEFSPNSLQLLGVKIGLFWDPDREFKLKREDGGGKSPMEK